MCLLVTANSSPSIYLTYFNCYKLLAKSSLTVAVASKLVPTETDSFPSVSRERKKKKKKEEPGVQSCQPDPASIWRLKIPANKKKSAGSKAVAEALGGEKSKLLNQRNDESVDLKIQQLKTATAGGMLKFWLSLQP